MKNNFGRAALLSLISMVLFYLLSLAVNTSIIQLVGYDESMTYVFLALDIAKTFVAFFLTAKFGNLLIFKRNTNTFVCMILSILATFLENSLILFMPSIILLRWFFTFAVYFLFILIIDKANEKFIDKANEKFIDKANEKSGQLNDMLNNSSWFKYAFPSCLAFLVFWIAADMIFWKILGAAMAFGLGFLISKWLEKKFSTAKSQSASITIKIILCILPILLALIIGFGSKTYDNHKDVFNKDPNKWTDEEKDYVNDFFEWHSNHYDD